MYALVSSNLCPNILTAKGYIFLLSHYFQKSSLCNQLQHLMELLNHLEILLYHNFRFQPFHLSGIGRYHTKGCTFVEA